MGKQKKRKIHIKTSNDADTNAEDNEIIDIDKGKVVTIEKQRHTLEYQETINLGIENIAISSQQIWRSIYELIDDSYFKSVKLFPTQFLDHCKKNETNLKIYQVKSKLLLKNWLWNKGCMHKWV